MFRLNYEIYNLLNTSNIIKHFETVFISITFVKCVHVSGKRMFLKNVLTLDRHSCRVLWLNCLDERSQRPTRSHNSFKKH